MAIADDRLARLVKSTLEPSGWVRSCNEGRPVTADGEPLPWITYPSQRMLEQMIRPEWRIFEYGAGWSSLWWAQRVREVVSVDHDEAWVRRVREMNKNVTVLHRGLGAAGTIPPPMDTAFRYIAAAQPMAAAPILNPDFTLEQNDINHGLNHVDFVGYAAALFDWPRHYFDVIVVDGMARAGCCYLSGEWVKPNGIVIVDNSDRWQYGAGLDALRDQGFGRIDFYGMSPGLPYQPCTSIFVKSMMPLLSLPPREKLKIDIDYLCGYERKQT